MDTIVMDETSLPDATMIDPTIDDTMVDLFGDAADNLAVTLPTAPLPGALLSRLSELHGCGCRTELAWSRNGAIAHISADGTSLSLRTMIRNKKDDSWILSDKLRSIFNPPMGRRFVHLQYNGIGTDLAVVDDLGHIHIYAHAYMHGRLQQTNTAAISYDAAHTELDAVVGFQWLLVLPNELKALQCGPTTKEGRKWRFQFVQRESHANRPHHPAEQRQALFYVSRLAKLTLMFQNENTWQSVSVALENVGSSRNILSHAAIGDYNDGSLLVTHDLAARIRVYKISIDWHASQQAHPQAQNTFAVAPTLVVKHLTMVDNIRAQHSSNAILTSLRVLPAVAATTQSIAQPITILGTFTQVPSQMGDLQSLQPALTILSSWHLEEVRPTLHESFRRLKPTADMASSFGGVTKLRRQTDIISTKTVLSVDIQSFDTVIALSASDGSVDFRDRLTLSSIEPFGDSSQVTSLSQSGFEHVPGDHNIQVALSADGSCLASINVAGELAARPMTFRYGWQTIEDSLSNNEFLVETGAISIARQYIFNCYSNVSADECLALLPREASQETRNIIARMVHNTIAQSIDIAIQEPARQQNVIKDNSMSRSLAAQLSLSTSFKNGRRTYPGQYAIAALSIRHVVTVIGNLTARGKNTPSNESPFTSKLAISAAGLIKWSLNLMVSIVNTMIEIKNKFSDTLALSQIVEGQVKDDGNPALHLLLSAFSRCLIRFQTTVVQRFLSCIKHQLLPHAQSDFEKSRLQEILDLSDNLPFKIGQVEELVQELDLAIRNAYSKGSLSDEQRIDYEIGIMVDGTIPDIFEPVVQSILTSSVSRIADTSGLGKLYFWETDSLSLATFGPPSSGASYDVIRKIRLTPSMSLRTCRRCGSETEDIVVHRDLAAWVFNTSRYCICLDFWYLA